MSCVTRWAQVHQSLYSNIHETRLLDAAAAIANTLQSLTWCLFADPILFCVQSSLWWPCIWHQASATCCACQQHEHIAHMLHQAAPQCSSTVRPRLGAAAGSYTDNPAGNSMACMAPCTHTGTRTHAFSAPNHSQKAAQHPHSRPASNAATRLAPMQLLPTQAAICTN
jgi:hypothetical protein